MHVVNLSHGVGDSRQWQPVALLLGRCSVLVGIFWLGRGGREYLRDLDILEHGRPGR